LYAVVAAGRRRTAPAKRQSRQLGHTNVGITSIYLEGIDSTAIIDTVHARPAPMVPVHSPLRI
jgi:hypothetical protein